MPDIDTAEYRKLALIAAGVSLQDIPPIIDTATWRKMMIAALLKNTANQAIAGRVDYYGQLPVTTGNPPIGTTYLVLNSSGIYYINYKSAGVYVKLTDTGSLSDWVYAPLSAIGTLPDVTLTNQQVGDTLTWNGSNWENSPLPTPTPTLTTSFVRSPQFPQANGGAGWFQPFPFYGETLSLEENSSYVFEFDASWNVSAACEGRIRFRCPEDSFENQATCHSIKKDFYSQATGQTTTTLTTGYGFGDVIVVAVATASQAVTQKFLSFRLFFTTTSQTSFAVEFACEGGGVATLISSCARLDKVVNKNPY